MAMLGGEVQRRAAPHRRIARLHVRTRAQQHRHNRLAGSPYRLSIPKSKSKEILGFDKPCQHLRWQMPSSYSYTNINEGGTVYILTINRLYLS
jgi:hypothetical protein